MEIRVMEKVLAANDAWAEENRAFLARRNITMFNLIGSPGAGKTALLERTIEQLKDSVRIGVIEGDLATLKDAERIQRKGVPVYQINTGSTCHLDANLVNAALKDICEDNPLDIVFVENVGNLVCPAEFDIGESAKIAILSVTEGDDKVEKYPLVFSKAGVLVISKADLLKHTDFNLDSVRRAFASVNRAAPVLVLDSLSGNGFDRWVEFVSGNAKAAD